MLDKTQITNIDFDGINHRDSPDYCDAYIKSADYKGEPMTEDQLDEINEDSDFIHENLISFLN